MGGFRRGENILENSEKFNIQPKTRSEPRLVLYVFEEYRDEYCLTGEGEFEGHIAVFF